MNFEEFTKSIQRNQWIEEDGIMIYVRKSIYKTHDFELATLNASNPGNGALGRFLDKYESKYVFFIENIFSKRLQNYFLRRNYKVHEERSNEEFGIICMIFNK